VLVVNGTDCRANVAMKVVVSKLKNVLPASFNNNILAVCTKCTEDDWYQLYLLITQTKSTVLALLSPLLWKILQKHVVELE
jgi:hypothetical protein